MNNSNMSPSKLITSSTSETLPKPDFKIDFVSTIYLSLTGKTPSSDISKMLNAILVSTINQNPNSASNTSAAMQLFSQITTEVEDVELSCSNIISEYRFNSQPIPGFTQQQNHEEDPVAKQLFKVAQTSHLDPFYPSVAQIMEQIMQNTFHKNYLLNSEGAISTILLTLQISTLDVELIFSFGNLLNKNRYKK